MKLNYLISLLMIAFSCYAQNESPFKIDPRKFIDNKITLAEVS